MQPSDAEYIIFCAEKMQKEKDSSELCNFWLESLKEHIYFISKDVVDTYIIGEDLKKEKDIGK